MTKHFVPDTPPAGGYPRGKYPRVERTRDERIEDQKLDREAWRGLYPGHLAERLAAQEDKRDAIRARSLRNLARFGEAVEVVNDDKNNCDAILRPSAPYSMGAFSPANLLVELAGALHALRDRVPNGWDGTPSPDEDPLQLTDDDERLTPLAGVGAKKPALDLYGSEDDGPPAENGVRWKEPREAQVPRRSKRNLQDELDARSKVREAVRNSGAAEFFSQVPADILDRVTVDDRARWALELLDAVCDEPPIYRMQWLRDEAVGHLRGRRRRETYIGPEGSIEFEPVGRSLGFQPEMYANVYSHIIAGRLFAEGYERRPRLLSHPRDGIARGVDVGEDVVCVERDLSPEELNAALADGSQPIVRVDGVVIAMREGEPKSFEKFQRPKVIPTEAHVHGNDLLLKPISTAVRKWLKDRSDEIKRQVERLAWRPDSSSSARPAPPPDYDVPEIRRGNGDFRALVDPSDDDDAPGAFILPDAQSRKALGAAPGSSSLKRSPRKGSTCH